MKSETNQNLLIHEIYVTFQGMGKKADKVSKGPYEILRNRE